MGNPVLAADLEDRRRLAFAALHLRMERIMAQFPDEPDMWFVTDSDLLDIADAWTTSNKDAECAMDDDGACVSHLDYHLLSLMLEARMHQLMGGEGQ